MSTIHPKRADRNRAVARTVLGNASGWESGVLLIALAVGANLLSAFPDINRVAAGSVLCVGVLARVILLARRAEDSLEAIIATNERPEKRQAVVLFLSNAPKPEVLQRWMEDPRFRGGIQSREVLDAMDRESWRMPVEAISYHFGVALQVVVIPSSGDRGTIHLYADFAALLDRLFEGKLEPPKYCGLQQLTQRWDGASGNWKDGIDFEDARELVAALFEVFRFLMHKCEISRRDVIIDVTGGTKVVTVAGAAVSLGKGQTFQYISGQN